MVVMVEAPRNPVLVGVYLQEEMLVDVVVMVVMGLFKVQHKLDKE
jgi:hypothetical protein